MFDDIHDQNKIIIVAFILLIVVAVGVLFLSQDREAKEIEKEIKEYEKNIGKIEDFGDLEEEMFTYEDGINHNFATFDEKDAEVKGYNDFVYLYVPRLEKDTEETVIDKKKVFFNKNNEYTDAEYFNFLLKYSVEKMIDLESEWLYAWIDDNDELHIDLDTSVYIGKMVKYFPLEGDECDCYDFEVDEQSEEKSLHLLLQNAISIANGLKGKDVYEMKDINFIYQKIPKEIDF